MLTREVVLDTRKWGGVEHWAFVVGRLGEDEHGVWLGAPPGTRTLRGPQGQVTFGHAFVICVPRARWWTAIFNDPSVSVRVYADVTTPAEWSGDTVTMVDLDLDVIERTDGTIFVDDEDEFAEHQVSYGYPPDVIERARATADELVSMLRARAEPFGTVGPAWLERLRRPPSP